MNESKMMMKGNKAKYFCLTLSFVGWMLLAAIPAGILEGIANSMSASGAALTIVAIIGGLFYVPVTVYMNSAFAGFYEILAGHLIKETEPAPVMPEAVAVPIMPNLVEPALESQPESSPEAAAETKPELPTETAADGSKSSDASGGDNPSIPKEL